MLAQRYTLLLFIALKLLIVTGLTAQSLSNLRCIELPASQSYSFDTATVVPNSFIIYQNDKILSDSHFSFSSETKQLNISGLDPNKPIRICYRVLPKEISKPYFVMDPPEVISTRSAYQFQFDSKQPTDIQSTYTQLDKSGSVSRGISVGNNRDMSLTGGLNLQMSGKIAPNLWLAASLTDANIPIQPEGNTAQLSDFDKVFIQIYNNKISATLGDYQLSIRENRFLKVDKKQQGFLFEVKPQKNDSTKFIYSGLSSASISKGKYHRQTLVSIEGNQGPYKLYGANNERFIIVIAASERVFINGVLLERGENGDYVIDYNAAEIMFTPRCPISRQSRITVEFEYSDRTYARFVAAQVSKWESKRTLFSVAVMSESDAKNQTYDVDLKDEWRTLLSEIGDNVDSAFVINVHEEEYNPESVQYALQDTSYQGVDYQIYRYSVNRDSARYRVGFSYVGVGNGNYVSVTGYINGKVYKWVAPENGVKQGDYEPITLLVTPKSKQNIALKAEHKFKKSAKIYSNITYSHSDINTFSKKDSHDNHGVAFVSGIEFGTDSSRWLSKGEYQFVHKYFETFERYRTTEFERDWNIETATNRANEHFATFSTRWKNKKIGTVEYIAEALARENIYKGIKNSLLTNIDSNKIVVVSNLSLVNSESDSIYNRFAKADIKTGYLIKKILYGVKLRAEENRRTVNKLALDQSSFRFYDAALFSETKGTNLFKMNISGGIRNDEKCYNSNFEELTKAKYIQSGCVLNISPTHSWELMANFKNIEPKNPDYWTDIKPENTLGGRITNRISLAKRAISLSNFYEIGSGLESKKEYAYMKTVPGEGTHIWRDLNNNGIKELSEFEIAPIAAEADYIRYFIPTDSYMNAYYCRYRGNININLNRWQNSDKKLVKIIAKLSNQTNFQVNHKTIDNRFLSYGNPFFVPNSDSVMLSNQLSGRNTLSYGRSNARWGADYIISKTQNKQMLANGFETRTSENQSVVLRVNFLQFFTVLNEAAMQKSEYNSQAFSFKDYTIGTLSDEVKLEINPNIATRYEIKYKYADKNNDLSLNSVEAHSFTLSFQYAKAQKGSSNVSIGYVHNNFSGNADDPTNFELLEGYQIGKNLTWQLGSIINLSKHFQLTLQYHGRTSPQIKTIHTGTVMIKAFF
ncbi:MAG TPA: hypothetical protein PLY32_00270 [Salinivirgaceae bacterium]|nr:hypothetical protein [Salinivirgaceae bacterium]